MLPSSKPSGFGLREIFTVSVYRVTGRAANGRKLRIRPEASDHTLSCRPLIERRRLLLSETAANPQSQPPQ